MSKMTNNKLFLLALAGLGALASGSAVAAPDDRGMTVDSKGGLQVFTPANENYWFSIGGRVFADQVFWGGGDNNLTGFPSGSMLRNVMTTFKGGVGSGWVYRLDVKFLDRANSAGRAQLGEAFLGYAGCKNLWVAVGQVSVPFGLENWQSANDTPFMEMALASEAFSPDNVIGVYAEWHGQMFTAAGAVFHPGAGETQGFAQQTTSGSFTAFGNSPPGSDPLGAGARITFSPIHNEQTVYHAGASARYVDLHNTQNNFNFITGMELRNRQTPALFSNVPYNSSDSYDVWGFELAGRWGPFQAAGEYMFANVNRPGLYATTPGILAGTLTGSTAAATAALNTPILAPAGDLNYHGFYVMASYVLTGESKEYDFDTGTFGRVHPNSPKGAWEIGARYDYIDLLSGPIYPSDTQDFTGDIYRPYPQTENDMVGGGHGVTIGLTYWVNDNVRFMANYLRASLPINQDLDAFGVRAQVNF